MKEGLFSPSSFLFFLFSPSPGYASSENFLFRLTHPWIPYPHPVNHTESRGPRFSGKTRSLTKKVTVTETPLLSQGWALLFFDEAIEFALDTLEAPALPARELLVEAFTYFFPLLAEVHAVVPDEVHFLFLVLRSRRSTSLWSIAGAAGNRVISLSRVCARR